MRGASVLHDAAVSLNQRDIAPGETYVYEFTLEMVQIGLGTMGFFVIHPKQRDPAIDRDFAILVNEWAIPPGTSRPDPNVMTDFDIFTFNSRVFPGTEPLVARAGDRVRIRVANVGQDSHPIHLHGHSFKVVATDGGDIPPSWPETTVLVASGTSSSSPPRATGPSTAIAAATR